MGDHIGALLERQEVKGTCEDSAGLCTCPVFIFNLDPKMDFFLYPYHSLLHTLQTKQKWFNISLKMEYKACYLTTFLFCSVQQSAKGKKCTKGYIIEFSTIHA